MKSKRQQTIDEKRVEKLYYKHCSGVQIDIMDIGKVFKVGVQAIDEGKSDDEVAQAVVNYVNTIRKN